MNIPFATIERTAKYLRCLRHLKDAGVKKVSSKELAEHTKTTPEQVRKDLSYFGRFGKTGTGYDISVLIKRLDKLLKVKKAWNLCIIGAGSLGSALAKYEGFKEIGYNIVAIFENDPSKIGKKIGNIEIFDIKDFLKITEELDIEIAILTIPQSSFQEVGATLSTSKIKGILNFIPQTIKLKTKRKIAILDIDLAQKMYILSYLIKNKKEE